jgi:hypothetical protein
MTDRFDAFRSSLPRSYVAFIDSRDGWEGDLGDDLGYVAIWSRGAVQEQWDAYEMSQYLGERWFPFGSDGGGEMLCFDVSSGTDQVYWIPFVGMSDDEATARNQSFSDIVAAIGNSAASDGE